MFGHAGSTTAMSLPGWSLVFAREPEPDPDLDDLPGEPIERERAGAAPRPPQKPPRRSAALLLLLLVIVAGVAYLSMNLEMISGMLPESVLDLLGEGPPVAAPPAPGEAPGSSGPLASNPDSAGRNPIPPSSPGLASEPPAPSIPSDSGGTPPSRNAMRPPGESSPPPMADMRAVGNAPSSARSVPTPLFGEGQRVTLPADPQTPGKTIFLTGDAAGTKPGPVVRPGAVLTVLDGELRDDAWVYSVRTQDGAKGWIPERRLKGKL